MPERLARWVVVLAAVATLLVAVVHGQTAPSDSGNFALDTRGAGGGSGGSQGDSANFTLDTRAPEAGGGVSAGDSGSFTVDTRGGTAGDGGSQGDSGNFTLDTRGGGTGTGGVSQGDSGNFTVDTRAAGRDEVWAADSSNFIVDTRDPYTLVVTTVGGGTVAKSPNLASYEPNAVVNLTATPAAGWLFAGWSGDATGTANPLGITMTGNKTITATFTARPVPTAGMMSAPALLSGHRFQFGVGGTPGLNYIIEARTNLAVGLWVPIFTNTPPFLFTDEGAGSNRQRFYRAVFVP